MSGLAYYLGLPLLICGELFIWAVLITIAWGLAEEIWKDIRNAIRRI